MSAPSLNCRSAAPCASIITATPARPQASTTQTATGAEGEWAPTITILGGAPDSGNLGVSALGTCAAKGALLAFPRARIILQSWVRDETVEVFIGDRPVSTEAMMVYFSQRLRARQGTRHLGMLGRWCTRLPRPLGAVLRTTNRTLAQLLDSDLVLDACGGDAFARIYGERPFQAQVALKRLALGLGKPLVLLPQTYGPFDSAEAVNAVRQIMGDAELVATREADGIEELTGWCGTPVARRAVRTPDMAFMLDPAPVDVQQEPAIARDPGDGPIIGVNVSGLLYLSEADFGLRTPYPDLVDGMLRALLDAPGARLILVPHVVRRGLKRANHRGAHRDHTDDGAIQAAYARLPNRLQRRVSCVSGPYDAGQTKYMIGRCDFFVGARMHACIAGISQCIPTATVAYSKKASQLMTNLGIGETVIDPRVHGADECVSSLRTLFEMRDEIRARLEEIMPPVKSKIESFFRDTLREAVLRRRHAAHR